MKNLLPTTVTKALGSGKLMLLKHAPGIMTYGGLVVIGVGIYLFCKASMRLEEVVDAHDERMEEIETKAETENLDKKEANKMIFDEKKHFTWEIVKLYGPAATTAICGFSLVLGGHGLINKRFSNLSAAYKFLERGYSQYRKRVRDDLGDEADRKYMYGLSEETKEVSVQDENGNETTVSTKVYSPKMPNTCSPYARFFDEFSTKWTRNPEYNLMFLNAQQNYANDRLHAVGHVFLNEVYEMLGLPHTQAGAIVGWVLNKGGDNCIDFGIYDLHDEIKRAFVNGYEPSILLDFNVDGPIYNLI